MKFLRISGIHYQAAKTFPYEANPALSSAPYQEQLKGFFSSYLNYGDSLTVCLRALGYEASEILYDVEPLQKRWAQEHGCLFTAERWQTEILIRQIQESRPEILFLYNSAALPLSVLQKRKELFPFLRYLVVFRGYPEIDRELLQLLSLADLLLVGSPRLEAICRNNRLSPHLFYHYFDDRVLSNVPQEERTHPFTFIGTSGYGYGWNHQPRYQYLLEILKTTPIECWLDESRKSTVRWKEALKRTGETFLSLSPRWVLEAMSQNYSVPSPWRKLAFNSLARKTGCGNGAVAFPDRPLKESHPMRCREAVFGLAMHRVLASSKITFNKHTFAASGTVDNIRLFEATGAGACLLTDHGSNLSDLFEADREVVSYSSLAECEEKAKYLLENDAVRKRIAGQGQKRTLKDHTASCRARQMHELLQNKKG